MGLASAELGEGLAIVKALSWKARSTGKQEIKICLKAKKMNLPSDKYIDTLTAEGQAFPSLLFLFSLSWMLLPAFTLINSYSWMLPLLSCSYLPMFEKWRIPFILDHGPLHLLMQALSLRNEPSHFAVSLPWAVTRWPLCYTLYFLLQGIFPSAAVVLCVTGGPWCAACFKTKFLKTLSLPFTNPCYFHLAKFLSLLLQNDLLNIEEMI